MNTIGLAMIVGGMAFLFSGFIFLLPIERKFFSSTKSFEESEKRFAHYLQQVKKERS